MIRKIIIPFLVLIVFVIQLFPTITIFAKDQTTFGSATIENPVGPRTDIMTLVGNLLKLIAELGAVVCVFFIIYSGFLFIKAQGEPAELSKAKSVFMWSVIGAAVLLGASVIAELITGTVQSVIGN